MKLKLTIQQASTHYGFLDEAEEEQLKEEKREYCLASLHQYSRAVSACTTSAPRQHQILCLTAHTVYRAAG
ncbi:hypothetical protein E2C01_026992 [Portunus trituberculatus]|uniref:Uncharacterized protein n=1 Tax=Portunus trituberculatus TaxID=210409 RepID=A0A5B7EK70_PORTR|nr:hypothetical protein [Portunus trituberculatus]